MQDTIPGLPVSHLRNTKCLVNRQPLWSWSGRAKKEKESKLRTRHVDIRQLKQRNDDEVYTKKDKTK